MESFSLLKYWRSSGGGTTTTAATTQPTSTKLTSDEESAGDDDGPFFDLEFAVPDEEEEEEENSEDQESKNEEENGVVSSTSDDEDDREFNFTLSSGSSNDRADNNLTLSPSDDLFFKGRLVPVLSGSESDPKPQFSLLKSATKLRVLMLRFKKMKAEHNPAEKPQVNREKEENAVSTQEKTSVETTDGHNNSSNNQASSQEKSTIKFKVKFKVEEIPMLSLFRDNSKNTKTISFQKQGDNNNNNNNNNNVECNNEDSVSDSVSGSVSVSVMNKYLKKVKPLYIRVSKRYGEKLKFSTAASSPPPAAEKVEEESGGEVVAAAAAKTGQKQGKIPAGLRVVCKHLGKSRSASSAAVAAAPPPPAGGAAAAAVSKRRDDSLLQQQDGIQSAILHCKRSFNASRDNESLLLSRSVSDPSHEKSMEFSGKKQGEGKSLGVTEENPKKAGIVA